MWLPFQLVYVIVIRLHVFAAKLPGNHVSLEGKIPFLFMGLRNHSHHRMCVFSAKDYKPFLRLTQKADIRMIRIEKAYNALRPGSTRPKLHDGEKNVRQR